MSDQLHDYLARDHERLDGLLAACLSELDPATYEAFRGGLLRHIGIEERLLFPLMRKARGSTELEVQLHRDHAAIAALLVPPPTIFELRHIASILELHNVLEEETGGLYEQIEALTGAELEALMQKVSAYPPVPLAPHSDTPILRKSIDQLLREADAGRRRLLDSREE